MILSRQSGTELETGATPVQWDARTRGDWTSCLETADAVINLAGESIGAGRWTDRQKERILKSRLDATNAIVDAMAAASRKPDVLISASGVDYYGHVEEGDVGESSPPGSGFMAETSARWEEAAMKAEQHGVRVATMRTGVVIGSEADAFKRMILPFRLFAGGPYGSGTQWFSWIHINDAVEGYIFVLEHPKLSGPFNLSSPNPVRVNQLARQLGEALRRPSFMRAPAFALNIALGEMSDLLLKGRKVIPGRLKEAGFIFQFPLLPDALKEVLR